jgi:DNA-binding transcriptional LysR family regulator
VLFDHLLNGQLTAAFSDGKPAVPALTGIQAFTEDLVILTPQTVTEINDDFKASHPTAFMFGTICSYRQRFEDWLDSQGIVPGRIVEISPYYSMLACVAAGGGICMMPKSLLEALPGASRVNAHEISDKLGSQSRGLCMRKLLARPLRSLQWWCRHWSDSLFPHRRRMPMCTWSSTTGWARPARRSGASF